MAEAKPTGASDVHQRLALVGLRATPPRVAIWHVLQDASDEPDAVDLLLRAQALEPRTSLGTVYRFLRELEQLGLATSRPVAHARARWRLGASNQTTARHGDALAAVTQLAAAFGFRLIPGRSASPPRSAS